MPYGLRDEQLADIIKVIASDRKVVEAVLFGSRAKGNFKPGSDIDIALKGSTLKLTDILKLKNKLDNLNLPYLIDFIIYEQVKDNAVIEHINRAGISIYKKAVS